MSYRWMSIAATILAACSTPSKDVPPSEAAGCPSERFVLRGDQVLDVQTHLTWRRCPLGPIFDSSVGSCSGPMYVALTIADAKAAAGRSGSGWRLPTSDEIAGIAGPACKEEFARLFPTVGAPIWTSSSAGAGKIYQFDPSSGPDAADENDAAGIVLPVKK